MDERAKSVANGLAYTLSELSRQSKDKQSSFFGLTPHEISQATRYLTGHDINLVNPDGSLNQNAVKETLGALGTLTQHIDEQRLEPDEKKKVDENTETLEQALKTSENETVSPEDSKKAWEKIINNTSYTGTENPQSLSIKDLFNSPEFRAGLKDFLQEVQPNLGSFFSKLKPQFSSPLQNLGSSLPRSISNFVGDTAKSLLRSGISSASSAISGGVSAGASLLSSLVLGMVLIAIKMILVALVITVIILVPVLTAIIILITTNSAYIVPPGSTITNDSDTADCPAATGQTPTNVNAYLSRDNRFAFPIGTPDEVNYDCTHWDYNKASDMFPNGVGTGDPVVALPIFAYTSGTISFQDNDTLGGNNIGLAGDDGRWYYYAHNCEVFVKVGERVEVGQVIATSDTTGSAVGTPEHLHFAINTLGDTFIGGDGNICPALDFKDKFGLLRCESSGYCKSKFIKE